MLFIGAVGAFAAFKVGPFQKEAALMHPLFRKSWMSIPIRLFAFSTTAWIASMLHTRFFPKFSSVFYKNNSGVGGQGISPNNYLHNHDLISKFRFFENQEYASAENEIEAYLDLYTSGPLTKAELLNRIADGRKVDSNYASRLKVKRRGKDKDDIFWQLGKIHGLENIAMVPDEELAKCGGDPLLLQRAVDKYSNGVAPVPAANFDELVEKTK